MNNKAKLYTIDTFVWMRRKDNSGNDKCYREGVNNIKTAFGLLYHSIKLLKNNDGITIIKNSPK